MPACAAGQPPQAAPHVAFVGCTCVKGSATGAKAAPRASAPKSDSRRKLIVQRRKREAGTYAEKQTRVEAEPCAAEGGILRTKAFSGCGPSLGEWSNTYCECNTRELKQPVCESSAPHATPCPPVRTPCTVSFVIKDTPRLLALVRSAATIATSAASQSDFVSSCAVCSDLDLCSRSRTLTLAVRPAPLR